MLLVRQSGDAPRSKARQHLAGRKIGIDHQLQGRDAGQVDAVILDLMGGPVGAEIPLLADYLPRLSVRTRRPAETELLRPVELSLEEFEPDSTKHPRLVENQADALLALFGCPPAGPAAKNQRVLDRKVG